MMAALIFFFLEKNALRTRAKILSARLQAMMVALPFGYQLLFDVFI